jgi:hypothetical protein
MCPIETYDRDDAVLADYPFGATGTASTPWGGARS